MLKFICIDPGWYQIYLDGTRYTWMVPGIPGWYLDGTRNTWMVPGWYQIYLDGIPGWYQVYLDGTRYTWMVPDIPGWYQKYLDGIPGWYQIYLDGTRYSWMIPEKHLDNLNVVKFYKRPRAVGALCHHGIKSMCHLWKNCQKDVGSHDLRPWTKRSCSVCKE